MGAKVELALPVSVVAAGHKLNVTAVTLGPRLQIGFLAMPEAVPHIDQLARLTEQAFDEVRGRAAAARPRPCCPRLPRRKAAGQKRRGTAAASARPARPAPTDPPNPNPKKENIDETSPTYCHFAARCGAARRRRRVAQPAAPTDAQAGDVAPPIAPTRRCAKSMAMNDKQDFEDATRGKLAELNDPLVKAADGRIVWDTRRYDFLKGDAPATVNPSLWRAAEAEHARRACSRWPTASTRSAATTSPT